MSAPGNPPVICTYTIRSSCNDATLNLSISNDIGCFSRLCSLVINSHGLEVSCLSLIISYKSYTGDTIFLHSDAELQLALSQSRLMPLCITIQIRDSLFESRDKISSEFPKFLSPEEEQDFADPDTSVILISACERLRRARVPVLLSPRELAKVLTVLQVRPRRLVAGHVGPQRVSTEEMLDEALEDVKEAEQCNDTFGELLASPFSKEGLPITARNVRSLLQQIYCAPRLLVRLGLVNKDRFRECLKDRRNQRKNEEKVLVPEGNVAIDASKSEHHHEKQHHGPGRFGLRGRGRGRDRGRFGRIGPRRTEHCSTKVHTAVENDSSHVAILLRDLPPFMCPSREMSQSEPISPIGDEYFVAANCAFKKSWLVKNESCKPWPEACVVIPGIGAWQFKPPPISITVGDVHPDETAQVSIWLTAPKEAGTYECLFHIAERNSCNFFGQPLPLSISVIL